MSSWEKFQHAVAQEVNLTQLYDENFFSFEVRYSFAQYIESHIESIVLMDGSDRLQEQSFAQLFMEGLIVQMEQKLQSIDIITASPSEFQTKLNMEKAITRYRSCMHDPLSQFRHIRSIILRESEFISSGRLTTNCSDPEAEEIKLGLLKLGSTQNLIRNKLSELKQRMENYMIHDNENRKKLNELQRMPINWEGRAVEAALFEQNVIKLREMKANMDQLNIDIMSLLDQLVVDIEKVQTVLLNKRLTKWQREQALAGNGGTHNISASLDELQVWFEELASTLMHTRVNILNFRPMASSFPENSNIEPQLEMYMHNCQRLLNSLVISAFIVEKQPPQVMKTNTRFGATVRMLLTSLNIQYSNPIVTVSILSEAQALQLKQTNQVPSDCSGDILNSSGNMEYQPATKHLTCSFRNMQLKKIKRAEKKGTESVMDEKFTLLFNAKFSLQEQHLNAWVMSLPVVVIVHGNQEPQSWATITWDNAFSDVNRNPFHVVDRVQWYQLSEALNMKFQSMTGRNLTNENLHYLCEKAFRQQFDITPNDKYITWAQFCKEPLTERAFTFWDWFYAIMKLTRDNLKQYWRDGLILGFIRKDDATAKLNDCAVGTFLLRFSDSELGGITIAIAVSMDNVTQTLMLAPFSSKDFGIRQLPDRINDLTQCVTLYPHIPKDEAFGKFYTPLGEVTSNGYVKPWLKTTVPISQGYPGTPSWNSPEASRDTPSVGFGGEPDIDYMEATGMDYNNMYNNDNMF